MRIALIACMARGRVIGKDNQMPWHLPADLKHFKAVTLGKPVVMGRRTFESIGRPLPGRHNIVITRQAGYAPEGVTVVSGIDDALNAVGDVEEVMIIGGGELYSAMLPRADRLYLTDVDLDVEGDTHFPDYAPLGWDEVERTVYQPDEKNHYTLTFRTLDRQRG